MKTIEVVAAIIRDGNRIFATQRGYGDWKDYWEFPGGKIEPGETPEDALIREIREELGAEIAVDSYLTTVEYDYAAFHLHMRCYLVHVMDGELILKEHEAARWLSKDELDSVAWLPADQEILPLLTDESRSDSISIIEIPKKTLPDQYKGGSMHGTKSADHYRRLLSNDTERVYCRHLQA